MSREYSDLVGDGGPQYNDQIQDEISIFDPLSETSNESSNDNDNIPLSMDVVTPSSGSDLKAAFFNMTNSIVGAGIVGIPMAFLNSGLFLGVLLMTVLTIVNDWTLRLIIINTKLSGTKTYTGFVTYTYGKLGKVVVLLSQGLFAFGGSIGFIIIIGDSIPHVIRPLFANEINNSAILSYILSRNSIMAFWFVLFAFHCL
ncbi:hypothetical protein CAS74_001403 [Pichia kudriavzevii]|uniref:Amino acid transporter transmembrane domain-containing protein n=1 Tax=Pichia kudriavzevii TaxID=4909 RepID=A0A1Z8JR72_PICKU|nr:hypothetical protein CAS74_001403 [Pichia kudriavzevii]